MSSRAATEPPSYIYGHRGAATLSSLFSLVGSLEVLPSPQMCPSEDFYKCLYSKKAAVEDSFSSQIK